VKKYIVDLTAEERDQLQRLLRSGKTAARKVTRAQILLKADDGLTDDEIAEEIGTCVPTVERTRKRFVEENLGCLNERPRPGQKSDTPRRAGGLVSGAASKAVVPARLIFDNESIRRLMN
jgi:hypothetical protein